MPTRLLLLLFLAHAAAAAPSSLEEAIVLGEVEACRTFLKDAKDVDQPGASGFPPLALAVSEGRLEIARMLLDRGAKVDASGPMGGTPLHAAAHFGYAELAQLLIDRGADVNSKASAAQQSPLHYAAQLGKRAGVSLTGFKTPPLPVDHLGVAKALIAKGADVNGRAMAGDTPLILAADGGSLEMVDLLLAKGADPFDAEALGLGAMDKAIKHGHTAIIDRLLAGGVPLDGSGEHPPPLHSAVMYGRADMVEHVLGKGAALDAVTPDGHTALMLAARGRSPEMVKLLLAKGADPKRRDARGRSAADIARAGKNAETIALFEGLPDAPPGRYQRPPSTGPSPRKLKKWRALTGEDQKRMCESVVRRLQSAIDFWDLYGNKLPESLTPEFLDALRAKKLLDVDDILEHPGKGAGSESLFVLDAKARKVRCTIDR